jgi:predicted MFS family arabinose efflux permease
MTARQLSILTRPDVPRLLVAGLVGRLPSAAAALAIGVVMRAAGQPYVEVGWALGLFAAGLAVGSPLLGRLVDRYGQLPVLLPSSIGSGAGFGLVALAVPDTAAVLVGAVLAGLATPPLEPCQRALWPRLVPERDMDAALAVDAAAQELIFIAGPLVVAACVAAGSPVSALWVGAGLGVVGSVVFALSPASRAWRPTTAARHWLGPLSDHRFLAVLATLTCSGAAIGGLNLVVVAYGESFPVLGGSGTLLALNALGALLGAIAYGAVTWRTPAPRRILACTAGMAAAYWCLLAVPGPTGMALLMIATGFFLAPLLAVAFAFIGTVVRAAYVTEAFAWIVTMFTIGNAAASPLAGAATSAGIDRGATVAAAAASGAVLVALAAQRAWARALPARTSATAPSET